MRNHDTTRRSRAPIRLIGLWLAAALTACGSGGGESESAPPPPSPGTNAGSINVTPQGTIDWIAINCAQYACTGLASDRRTYNWGSNQGSMLTRDVGTNGPSAVPLLSTRPTRP